MKTFVINLNYANKRLDSISNQLEKLKIPFEVFPAVNWKELTKEEIKKIYDADKSNKFIWRGLTLWEIGCALSHLLLYKKIVEENIDIAFILEDDAIISKDIKKIYDKLSQKKTKWDYISVSYHIFDKKEFKRYWWYIYNNFFKKWKILKFAVHFLGMLYYSFIDYFPIYVSKIFWPFIIRKYKASYSTWWYFITNKWAKKLLEVHNKVFVPSDLLPENFWKLVKLKFALCVPRLVNQNPLFESCIDAIEERKYVYNL